MRSSRAILARVGNVLDRLARGRQPSGPDAIATVVPERPEPPHGAWDYPSDDTASFGSSITRDGHLAVMGWAFHATDPVTVRVLVDGRTVSEAPPRARREDIDIILSHRLAEPVATGWAEAIDVRGLSAGDHAVSIVLDSGRATTDLGTRRVLVDRTDADDFLARLVLLLRCPRTGRRLHLRDGRVEVDGTDASYPVEGSRILFGARRDDWREHATSVYGFSGFARQIVESCDGFVLSIGAGIARSHPRVVQMDVFDYPNIDVVSDGSTLPFGDGVFDGVICENVIEHVEDPFALTAEMSRVLKLGGKVGFNGTNMHFTHGFPSHYFNPTEYGMRLLAERIGGFEGECHNASLRESLRVIFRYYLDALEPGARGIVDGMTVGEFHETLGQPDVELSERGRAVERVCQKARDALTANVYFVGTKVRTP